MAAFVSLFVCVSALCAQSVEELVNAGDALDGRNRNSEALSRISQGRRARTERCQDPPAPLEAVRSVDARRERASEERQLGEKALDAAKRAVAANPNNSQAHLSLAIAYGRIALGEPARRKIEMSRLIKQEAETAVRLDPEER